MGESEVMRRVVSYLLAVLFVFAGVLLPVYADDDGADPADSPVAEEQEQEEEEMEDDEDDPEIDFDGEETDRRRDRDEEDEGEEEEPENSISPEEWLVLFFEKLDEFLTSREGEELPELEEPPDLASLFGSSGSLVAPASIITQSAYPYTGGAFMALNTNYGNGVFVVAENYKQNTFGFRKNTDRVVNLTTATISGYWIMNGTTYNARFTTFSEPQYAYVSGSTTTWRTLTVSALTDSNIQFLDETGERGIQRPYMTLSDKLLVVLIFVELAIHGAALVRRR